jgi:hypothetical protein
MVGEDFEQASGNERAMLAEITTRGGNERRPCRVDAPLCHLENDTGTWIYKDKGCGAVVWSFRREELASSAKGCNL